MSDPIRIEFEAETPFGIFRDALVFFDSALPDQAEIEAMKQARVDAWLSLINQQPIEPLPGAVDG